MRAEIVGLTSGKLATDTNLPKLEARAPLSNLDDDYEPFGELDGYQALGLTAMPFAADNDGYAEGVVLTDVGNTDGVVVGARDDRCAHVYANLKPGETVIHSTEPEAKSQVRCSPDGQVSIIVTDANGDTSAFLVDGKNVKVQIAIAEGLWEMSEENGLLMVAPGGKCSITMKDDTIMFVAKTVLLGGPSSLLNVLASASDVTGTSGLAKANLHGVYV